MRWDLNGDGAVDASASTTDSTAYVTAFPSATAGMGCPSLNCTGYELTADLDFDEDNDDQITAVDTTYWNSGAGWLPIGTYTGRFKGNNQTISNLFISRASTDKVGLFSVVSGDIFGLGLKNVNVRGQAEVGGLVGLQSGGRITACYVTGRVEGRQQVGGLVGYSHNRRGRIVIAASYATAEVVSRSSQFSVGGLIGEALGVSVIASYAIGPVNGNVNYMGGLIGRLDIGCQVTASYATGWVTRRSSTGGLIARNDRNLSPVTHSYWDTERSGQSTSAGGTGKTTVQLQSPTSYTSTAGNTTAIYSAWNVDVDGVPGNDDPWTFGASDQYPVLKYAGMDTPAQFAAQLEPPRGVKLTTSWDTLIVRWNAVRNATGYKVQWKSGDQNYAASRQASVTDTSSKISGLAVGTTYTVRVLATKTGASDGPPSSEVTGSLEGPRNVRVTPGVDSLTVTWDAVSGASGYRVQWKSGSQAYPSANHQASTHGQATVSGGSNTTYAIAMLTNGTPYTVRVLATRSVGGDSAPSSEVLGVPGIRYDSDGDGYIEIRMLAQLHAMRWDRNGDGTLDAGTSSTDSATYVTAFPNAASSMGCPSHRCVGYELAVNLTFDENNDGKITATGDPTYWNGGKGWEPIVYYGHFKGNNKTISYLYCQYRYPNNTRNNVGLFQEVRGDISGIGLLNVAVHGKDRVGGLVGVQNDGSITGCYVAGGYVEGDRSGVGGLVGRSWRSRIAACYTRVTVKQDPAWTGGSKWIGGLVGRLTSSSSVSASYATGQVDIRDTNANDHANGGGLVGFNEGTIRASYALGRVIGDATDAKGGLVGTGSGTVIASYWDSESSGIEDDNDAAAPEGKTTVQLQSPTSYTSSTGNTSAIYAGWNVDVDGVSGNDDPWWFGASDQYPILKYAGMDTTTQLTAQFAPQGVTLTAFEDSLVVRWNVMDYATGYKVQWKSGEQNYPTSDQTGNTHGQATVSSRSDTTYTIEDLTRGTLYTVRVLATWPGMTDSAPSSEILGVPGIRYDSDEDGYIEIGSLAQLHAMRWDRNGDGTLDAGTSSTDSATYVTAFPTAASSMGCPASRCVGYELAVNLTFPASTNSDYNPWSPINNFNTTLEGNGRTLTDLNVDLNTAADAGLFGSLASGAVIRNLGLVNPTVVSSTQITKSHGGVAGYGPSGSTINAVYILGGAITTAANESNAGALAGLFRGTIRGSYSTASVRVSGNPTGGNIGGLVGHLNGGQIIASYVTGAVSGGTGSSVNVGGLVGRSSGAGAAITASYCDTDATLQANCIGSQSGPTVTAPGYSATQLRVPTGYTGIYTGWNLDVDGISGNDDPWTFGASDQYPVLKYTGMDTTAQFAAQFVPRGVTLTAFADSLVVRWIAVRNATGYKVQWKSGSQAYPSANHQASTHGQATVSDGSNTTYAIAMLTNGTPYTVRVLATRSVGGDSDPSSEVLGTPGIRYDSDEDGYIEIRMLAQLHAMRWDRNGDGTLDAGTSSTDSATYVTAFPTAASSMGCPASRCVGYELLANLTFDENNDGKITATGDPTYWNGGKGWEPIVYYGHFKGNNKTISYLYCQYRYPSNTRNRVGLFHEVRGDISGIGLLNVAVHGTDLVGGLVGVQNGGSITGCYVAGGYVEGSRYGVGGLVGRAGNGRIAACYTRVTVKKWHPWTASSPYRVGGLVGQLISGTSVTASYATGQVDVRGFAPSDYAEGGGLVGVNDGTITASYALGRVIGDAADATGGLVGTGSGTVIASYWDSESSGIADDEDATAPEGKSSVQLRSPTSDTGIYANWGSLDVNGNGMADEHPWTFGASDQYPVLKYAGMDTTAQFAAQPLGVPQGVTLTPSLDTLIVRWSAMGNATGYKVQWKADGQSYNTADRQATVSGWNDTTYTLANLMGGTPYTVRVIATKTGASDSAPSAEVTDILGIRYDGDGNGLIEIETLAQLNAMRWDLNGDGALDSLTTSSDTTAYRAAFPNAALSMGCPASNCIGYELMADLDFDENDDNQITAADATYWNDGKGWDPIGPPFGSTYGENVARINNLSFNATFEGNGHIIANLYIDSNRDWSGLFSALRGSAVVRSLGLPNAQVRDGGGSVAPLAGQNSGRVAAVWATGSVRGNTNVGGLVGSNQAGSVIVASYAMASVECKTADGQAGGLAGNNADTVRVSYSTGSVTGACSAANKHGLTSGGTVIASYWDSDRSGIDDDIDTTAPEGKTTVQLQSPTSYSSTAGNTSAIYSAWNVDVDGVSGNDDPWTFGASDQYPVLKYADMDTTAQFAAQPPGVPQGVTLTALVDSLVVSWTAVSNATGGYKVQWKSGPNYDAASRQSLVTGTRDTIPSLTAGTPYTVRVIAIKTGAPDSRPSAEQTGVPKFPPPGVPGNVTVTPQVLALHVTWVAATNADGYKVRWKAAGDAYDAATREYAVGGTDTTIVGLTAGISYTVRVLATREHADDGPASSEPTGTPLAIPSLSITSPIVAEGATGATDTLRFAVTLSHASQHAVTVAYADARTGTATSGTDYTTLADGTLTLAPGVLSDTLAVSVTGDGMDEPDETVDITLSSPTNATFAGGEGILTGSGTITDDDATVATLVLSPEAISENGGIATVTATLSSAESAAVTITISAAPVGHAVRGDFSLLTPATLTIAEGETTSMGLVTITANDNNARAPTKSVTVSGTADAANTVADPVDVTLWITDDESPQVTLALSSAAILENGGMATVTAMLDRPATTVTITVSAAAVAPAEAGDFSVSTARTLTIAADSLTSTGLVTITAIDDTLDGLDKSVTVSGTATGGNNATAPPAVTLTITDDDDPPMFSITSPRLDEGNTGSVPLQFRVTLSAASEKQITVAYAMGTGTATAGEDYTALAAGTLTFAPGTASQTLAVSITGDGMDEPDETVLITLRDPTSATFTGGEATLTGTGTITDDDPAVATLVLSPEAISENGGITTVTATLSNPEGVAVTITVSATPEGHAVPEDFSLSTEKTLTIAANGTTSTGLVTITARDNPDDAPDKSVKVSGTADDTADTVADPVSVTLTIIDDDDPVSIPDTGLRAVIEDSLDKASGAAITRAEMATLTRLIAPNKTIRDLTGLEFATGLDTLDLSDNNIEDIEPLVNNAGLGTGAAIDLRGNPLSAQSHDVHIPALEARGVSVQVTPSVSIPDAGLRAVIEDSLNKASGSAITRAEMATLTRLVAPNKTIRDLTGLEFATGLDTLDLSDNNIEDIEPLVNNAGLGAGAAIDLRGNPLSAQSHDVHIPALEARGVSVQVTPSVSIPDAGLRAVIEDSLDKASGAAITRAEMATLTRLIAPNKNIRDLTGLEFATGLDTLNLSDNNIEDIEPLVNNAGLGAGAAIDLRGNPLSAQSRDVHIPALEARGVSVHVQPTTNLDVDADGTADLTDAIMVILYLFGLENEGITDYILFSQQATRTDPQDVTAYIKTLIATGRIDIDADGTVDLTDIIMVILYLFGLENEGITDYILFSQQATRTDPQAVTAYIASLLP